MENMTHKTEPKLDVFITLHEKDIPALPLCIKSISKHMIPHANRLTILSNDIPSKLLREHGLSYIHESEVFDDLTYERMPRITYKGENRTGWYFQQLLKWEARRHSTTDNYVVVDADTVFIEPTVMIHDNKYVFFRSDKYHKPYFETYEKLFGYFPEKQESFIADFMILNKGILDEIITRIEDLNNGRKWYEIILETIDKAELSSFSEFETYGYYMSKFYPHLFESRRIRNKILEIENVPYHWINKILYKIRGYASISYHCYRR